MSSELELQNETLETLVGLAQQAVDLKNRYSVIPIPNDVDNRYILVTPQGHEIVTPELAPREILLGSVDQFSPFVEMARTKWCADPIVYYNKNGIKAMLLESELRPGRGGSAKCVLKQTPQWTKLEGFAAKHDDAFMSHEAIVRMLRMVYAECLEPESMKYLLGSLETLDWVQGQKAVSTAVRNRESLGTEVKSEVKSSGVELPTDITLKVRIFRDPGLLQTREIRCYLETRPSTMQLAIIPYQEDLERAMDDEMCDLGDLLRAGLPKDTPVFFS